MRPRLLPARDLGLEARDEVADLGDLGGLRRLVRLGGFDLIPRGVALDGDRTRRVGERREGQESQGAECADADRRAAVHRRPEPFLLFGGRATAIEVAVLGVHGSSSQGQSTLITVATRVTTATGADRFPHDERSPPRWAVRRRRAARTVIRGPIGVSTESLLCLSVGKREHRVARSGVHSAPSFSGLGRRPFTAVARVRIPLGSLFPTQLNNHGPVAQLVSVPPCHGGGRGFKSRQGRSERRAFFRGGLSSRTRQTCRAAL